MTQQYSGGCQCGKVRYEVQMDFNKTLQLSAGGSFIWYELMTDVAAIEAAVHAGA
jgi:hypothetical protein